MVSDGLELIDVLIGEDDISMEFCDYSEDAKYNFEPTGSRIICGFYDLANTYKIFAEDEEAGGFWLALVVATFSMVTRLPTSTIILVVIATATIALVGLCFYKCYFQLSTNFRLVEK